MNVLADENLHRTIVARLVADGHEVADVGDLAPSITDDEVLALAIERRALLVTNDLDFGELVFVRGARHAGVLVLRLGGMPYADQAALVASTIARQEPNLVGAFSVLTESHLRIRLWRRP